MNFDVNQFSLILVFTRLNTLIGGTKKLDLPDRAE